MALEFTFGPSSLLDEDTAFIMQGTLSILLIILKHAHKVGSISEKHAAETFSHAIFKLAFINSAAEVLLLFAEPMLLVGECLSLVLLKIVIKTSNLRYGD